MAITRIKTNQITDLNVTGAKIANATIAGGKLATNLSYGSDLTVTGNLTVSGTTVAVATTNTRVDDALLVLAFGTSGSPSEDSGFIIDRGSSNNMAFLWDESADVFILCDVGAEDADTAGNVTVSGTRQTLQMGPLVATTGTFSGVVSATGITLGSAVIVESELEMIDGITAGTAAASKAVVLDGSKNIATIGTIGCGAITSSGVVTGTGFTIGSAVIIEAELETIDGVTAGTVAASKAVVVDASKDIGTFRNLTIDGTFSDGNYTFDTSGNVSGLGTIGSGNITSSGTVQWGSLSDGTITVTAFVDEDDMSSNSATLIPTQQSVKAYVDAEQASFIISDGSTTQTVADGNTITFTAVANETTVAVSATDTVTIGLPDDVTVAGVLTVTGNLVVNGTTTTVATTNAVVKDTLLELNTGAGSNANDMGLIMERGSTGDNALFIWDESGDVFSFGTTSAVSSATGNISFAAAGINASTGAFSGVVTAGGFTIGSAVIAEAELEMIDGITAGTAAASKAVVLDGSKNIATIGTIGCGAITSSGVVSATGITLGSAVIVESELEMIDGITAGTAAASKAVVLDGSKNIATIGTIGCGAITSSGVVTGTGFTIGSAAIIEAELEMLDTVTAGTVAASKVVVVDGNLDIASFRNLSATGDISVTDAGSLRVGTGNDFTVSHNGTDTTIANGTGIMAFTNTAGSAFRFNENSADVDFIVETNGNAAALHVDGGNNNVGVGGAPNSNAAFHVNSTGGLLLPVGTTGQRPTGVSGMFRYNSTTGSIEYYDSNSWEGVSSSFTIATTQAFAGDNSTVAFTLSALSGSDSYITAGILVMLNGVVQVPTTVYAVSGVTLTFTTAPASGDVIDVRKFTTTTTVVNLSDADGDTLVQTEESADEDKIRFDCGGSQIALIDGSGITLSAGTLVGTADLATSITAVANNSTDETTYLTFVDAATGTQGIETDSGLTYNPSSGTLTTTILTGTASAAKYADLAERYASDEEIEPGTVVQFVGEGKVAMCMNDSSRSVAGIVSTDPAYLMNSDQAGVSLAIAGRVPCKVIGTVKTGDLMVCAGEGYARAEENPALGTVIGKAIESFSGTTGVIEVLTMMM